VVSVRIGGYVVNGLTGVVIATWKLPWDCEILGVDLDYITDGQHLDAVTLKTVDATALTIVTIGNLSTNVAAVAQTLHSDVVGVTLVKGNKIQLKADTTDGTERGFLFVDLHLRPVRG
jgi:hypothetical protein